MGQRKRQFGFVAALALVFSFGLIATATAATSQTHSSNYSVNEVQIGGAGSALKTCGSTYCGKISVGDTVAGRASSANYSAQLGFNTSDVPLLEVITEGGTQNMGVIDSDATGTATNYIKVRNYLSSGYVLQITGMAPNQGTHTLHTSTTPVTSQPGTEQFGINLAANTTPHIGANPVQVPSSTFSFGHVISDGDVAGGDDPNGDGSFYNLDGFFAYKDGDIVARSNRSTGETDYTMSMIINVSNVTPGGRYSADFSAVAVPTF